MSNVLKEFTHNGSYQSLGSVKSARTRSIRPCSAVFLFYICLCVLLSSSMTLASENGTCMTEESSYYCPNCGGYNVNDCLECHGYYSTDSKHGICFDRKLFAMFYDDPEDFDNHFHYIWNDLFGMVVWFVVAGVSIACGVGGGGIYVPLGILIFQFAPKQSSGLSQASIFGASVGGLLLNSRNKHPNTKIRSDPGVSEMASCMYYDDYDTDAEPRRHMQRKLTPAQEQQYIDKRGGRFYTRALINYDMALFLAPMEMAGANLGVLLQKVLPNWLYLFFAVLVLSFTAYKTYTKFFHAREQENKERLVEALENAKAEQDAETISVDVSSIGFGDSRNNTPDKSNPGDKEKSAYVESENDRSLRIQYLEEDMRQYPTEKVGALLVLWFFLFLMILFKGGKGVDSLIGITCESPWYAVLTVLQLLATFFFSTYYGLNLIAKQKARVQVRYPFLPGDPVWDKPSCVFYGSCTLIAGFVAGLIGTAGGMVLGPLMLVMGIHPSVSSATTASMVVLTSSSVAVMYVTSGLVPWSYAVYYFGVCLCGAYLGKSKIDGYIKRTRRASILIFTLATIIASATMGSLYIMITHLAVRNWCLDGFLPFCPAHETDPGACVMQLHPN